MGLFWVVGGESAGAHCQETVGSNEEFIGPFRDYAAAQAEWAKHAGPAADDQTARFRIELIDPEDPPPCTD